MDMARKSGGMGMIQRGRTAARKMVCSCEGTGSHDVIIKHYNRGDDLDNRGFARRSS